MPKFGALYRCVMCGHEFAGYCGPQFFDPMDSACPKCLSRYVNWLNYPEVLNNKKG